MEHIKDRMADFVAFKEELVIQEMIYNKIQTIVSFWKEDLETVVENNEKKYSSEKNSYYWLSCSGIQTIVSMNPYENLE